MAADDDRFKATLTVQYVAIGRGHFERGKSLWMLGARTVRSVALDLVIADSQRALCSGRATNRGSYSRCRKGKSALAA